MSFSQALDWRIAFVGGVLFVQEWYLFDLQVWLPSRTKMAKENHMFDRRYIFK